MMRRRKWERLRQAALFLLPIAAAGINIEALMEGAREEMELLAKPGMDNPAWQYAAAASFSVFPACVFNQL